MKCKHKKGHMDVKKDSILQKGNIKKLNINYLKVDGR